MSERYIKWIDALKGFGIILVTVGHLNPWFPIETHIYSFHMCLFFFISGYLFKNNEPLKITFCKKIQSILVPFVIWDFLSSIMAFLMGERLYKVISGFFMINGENVNLNAPLWFLLILFFAEIFYAVIMSIRNSNISKYIVLGISGILFFICGSHLITLKFNLVPLAVFFYTLGDIFHLNFENKKFSNVFFISFLLIAGSISIIFGGILNIRVIYTYATFGNIFYFMLSAICGTLFYWLLFKKLIVLGESKLLIKVGKNSLIIMAAQYPVFFIFKIISQKLLKVDIVNMESTLKSIIIASVTIFLIMIVATGIKRVSSNHPKMLNFMKLFGIR